MDEATLAVVGSITAALLGSLLDAALTAHVEALLPIVGDPFEGVDVPALMAAA